jgi:type I restriction enzyme M protein
MPMTAAPRIPFNDYLTVGQAAALLGVSITTLRNWDRQGKFRAIRHPINAYRLYCRDDLLVLLPQSKGQPAS